MNNSNNRSSQPKTQSGQPATVQPATPAGASVAIRKNENAPPSAQQSEVEEDLPPPTTLADDEEPMRRGDLEWDDSDGENTDGEEEGSAPAAAAPEEDDSEEEEDVAESRSGGGRPGAAGSHARARPERRPFPSSANELFTSEIPYRLQRADEKLRQNLAGKVLVKVSSGQERRPNERKGNENCYLLDWSGTQATVKEVPAAGTEGADCTISVHEQTLLRIANGELNPQIVMLSDKLRVEGQATLGIYFFNLVAPQH